MNDFDIKMNYNISPNHLIIRLFIILIIFFNYSFYKIDGSSQFMPNFSLLIIFFYSIYMPDAIPIWFIILFSIYEDAIIGSDIIGFNIICNLTINRLVINNRITFLKEDFPLVWSGLAIVTFIIMVLKYSLSSILYMHIFDINNSMMQSSFTILLYPLFHFILSKIT